MFVCVVYAYIRDRISWKPHVRISPNFCARCVRPWLGGILWWHCHIRYLLPVLWVPVWRHVFTHAEWGSIWFVMCDPGRRQQNITTEKLLHASISTEFGWLVGWCLTALLAQLRSYRASKVKIQPNLAQRSEHEQVHSVGCAPGAKSAIYDYLVVRCIFWDDMHARARVCVCVCVL